MYKTILVTLDATPTDRGIIEHIKQLAAILGSNVVLLHVATGVPALWHGTSAAGEEVEQDRAYLEQVRGEFAAVASPLAPSSPLAIPPARSSNGSRTKGATWSP